MEIPAKWAGQVTAIHCSEGDTVAVGAVIATAAWFVIEVPFSWSGGGGPVGNRYFLGTYGVFLFLVPPLQTNAVWSFVSPRASASCTQRFA